MIDLIPDSEEVGIIDSVRELLQTQAAVSRLQNENHAAEGGDRQAITSLGQYGWIGMTVPERLGGAGARLSDEVLMFMEAGRQLISPVLLAYSMAAKAGALKDESIVRDIMAGSAKIALANPKHQGPVRDGAIQIFDGRDADLVVLCRRDDTAVYRASDLVRVDIDRGFDDTVHVSVATVENQLPVCRVDHGAGTSNLGLSYLALLNAMMVGLSEAARDLAVDYAKTRQQFDRPIGSFQAIKHTCADMAVRCEAARCATLFSTLQLQTSNPESESSIAAANILARRAALENSSDNIQVHGAIGVTLDYAANRFLKRARLLSFLGQGLASMDGR